MNTAEMLQAAFKYVKYLQAQVGILENLGSSQEDKEERRIKELEILASAGIQEKLYLEEKCLVPSELEVVSFMRHHQFTTLMYID
ncbi:hypothetical protein RCOM_1574730 [Ricinus communis]|uniref:BHLH domain-containing protein n=1 Tax=Ricinus communis TaxID=3988 RepID=B9RHZ8_RICCO|nr:hypothetical protein RCOM_1574730 [Ricinus communis]